MKQVSAVEKKLLTDVITGQYLINLSISSRKIVFILITLDLYSLFKQGHTIC